MYIAGGDYNKSFGRQISLVENCGLRRVGTLPYDFNGGSCNNFITQDGTEEALLCFGYTNKTSCIR